MLAWASTCGGNTALSIFIISLTNSEESAKNYLEFIYNAEPVAFGRDVRSVNMVLNKDQFSEIRKTVEEKLGNGVSSMIKEITLCLSSTKKKMPSLPYPGCVTDGSTLSSVGDTPSCSIAEVSTDQTPRDNS